MSSSASPHNGTMNCLYGIVHSSAGDDIWRGHARDYMGKSLCKSPIWRELVCFRMETLGMRDSMINMTVPFLLPFINKGRGNHFLHIFDINRIERCRELKIVCFLSLNDIVNGFLSVFNFWALIRAAKTPFFGHFVKFWGVFWAAQNHAINGAANGAANSKIILPEKGGGG